MCLAVGSGITPILSIVKSVLTTEPKSNVTLLYGNRRTNTVMFKEELSFIKNRFMSRLKVDKHNEARKTRAQIFWQAIWTTNAVTPWLNRG